MNLLEAIKERRSVRSYDGNRLTDLQIATLLDALNESSSPFGGRLTIRLKEFDLRKGYRPTTYGMIKGARHFFLLASGADGESALSTGFRFEQIVLKAWQMGLGTCWIAATFKGSDFDRDQTWPEGETLRIVCPVGTAAPPTATERLTRLALRSANRLPFDRLFYHTDFHTPLHKDNRFAEPLEMLRLAPSSTNSQPWRALVCDNHTVHFYYRHKSDISLIDCGIGFCHFHKTEKFRGHDGIFFKADATPAPPRDWKYLISYTTAPA